MATPDQVTDPVASRLLRRLRDSGALSRAELASRLEVPRARLLSELDSLLAAGLVCEAGPAASRGGRRSTLVELNRDLRFAAVDLGARSPVSPPIMPGWDRYPVREVLGREHGCPVVVDNDVNIMAIGEHYGGVAHRCDQLDVAIGHPVAQVPPNRHHDHLRWKPEPSRRRAGRQRGADAR